MQELYAPDAELVPHQRAPPAPRRTSTPSYVLTIALVVALILLWTLRDVALLCFAAIVLSSFLLALSEPLCRRTPLPARLALLATVAAIVVLLVVAVWATGVPIAAKVGFSEFGWGRSIPACDSQRAVLIRRIYGYRVPTVPAFVGGNFYWPFRQTMSPKTRPDWQLLREAAEVAGSR